MENPNYLVFSDLEEVLVKSDCLVRPMWVGVVDARVVAMNSDRKVVDDFIDQNHSGKDSFVGQIPSRRPIRMRPFMRILFL